MLGLPEPPEHLVSSGRLWLVCPSTEVRPRSHTERLRCPVGVQVSEQLCLSCCSVHQGLARWGREAREGRLAAATSLLRSLFPSRRGRHCCGSWRRTSWTSTPRWRNCPCSRRPRTRTTACTSALGARAGSGAGLMLTRQRGQYHLSLALWAWVTYEIPKKPSHFSCEGGTA